MKYLFYFILIILWPIEGYNQIFKSDFNIKKSPLIYADIDGGLSNGLMLGIYGNIQLNNSWGLNIGYNHYNRNSKELPSDFYSGFCLWDCTPTDKFFTYSFRLTKGFKTKTQLIRYKFELGLALVQLEQVHFHPVTHSPWSSIGSNYYETHSTYHNNGISLRAVTEFPFSQVTGLQIALLGTLAKNGYSVGIQFGITFGYVREKFKHKNKKNED
jgi:hypothetical protein